MTYGKFAYLYDDLMKDVPYDEWVRFLQIQVQTYGVEGQKILDLACGTGELSIRLSSAGFEVTGVDLSAEMLTVAREKADRGGLTLFLVEQDMSQLELPGVFDIIGIFCDSVNYLQEETEIIHTFERALKHLKTNGLFLFDVHSLYKMTELFANQTYAYNGEEISYIWQCFEGEYPYSVEHELSFFELDHETGQYHRYDELHYQRTFTIEQYQNWLEETGFELLSVTADFQDEKPGPHAERIFFTARKK